MRCLDTHSTVMGAYGFRGSLRILACLSGKTLSNLFVDGIRHVTETKVIRDALERGLVKESKKIIQFRSARLRSPPFITCGMFNSRMLQVIDLGVSKQLVASQFEQVDRRAKNIRRCGLLKTCSQVYTKSSLSLSRQIIHFVQNTNLSFFMVTEETTFDKNMIHLAGSAPRGSPLFCLHGKGSWA